MKTGIVNLIFQSKESDSELDTIASDSDYGVSHYLIQETEIIEANKETNQIVVKCLLGMNVDEKEIQDMVSELNYYFKNSETDNEYEFELIDANTNAF